MVSFQFCVIDSKTHLENINYYFPGLSTVPILENKNVGCLCFLFLIHFCLFPFTASNNYDVEHIGSLILCVPSTNNKKTSRLKPKVRLLNELNKRNLSGPSSRWRTACVQEVLRPADFRLFIYLQNLIENVTFDFAVRFSTFGRTHLPLQTLSQNANFDFSPH